jgi:hypothetical protein
MAINRPEESEVKIGVSISEMARSVGLSRQRFHQLMTSGVFPKPLRDEESGRPYYDETSQAQCLEVRRRNCGVNGKIVLFYARRQQPTLIAPTTRTAKPRPTPPERHDDILEGVKSLGMSQVTAAQVGEIVKQLYPAGVSGVDSGEVIRAVFLRLRVKNSADNLGR